MRCLRVSVQAGLTADRAWRASRAQLRGFGRRGSDAQSCSDASRPTHGRRKNRLWFHFRAEIEQRKMQICGRLLRTNDFGAQKIFYFLGHLAQIRCAKDVRAWMSEAWCKDAMTTNDTPTSQ